MVKRQLVSYSYTCDVCGEAISDGDHANRAISWEGTEYVVDVCSTHGSQLGELLSQLKSIVDAGTRVSSRRGRRTATATSSVSKASRGPRAASGASAKRGDVSAVRVWARDNGMKVSERGRIPGELLAAYQAALSGAAAAAPSTPAAAAAPDESATPRAGSATAAAARAPRSRRATAATSKAGSSPKRTDLGAVRAWARDNGMKVSERGRIPGELLAAYDAANNGSTSKEAPAARTRRARKTAPAAG